jgi:hypothetical protein
MVAYLADTAPVWVPMVISTKTVTVRAGKITLWPRLAVSARKGSNGPIPTCNKITIKKHQGKLTVCSKVTPMTGVPEITTLKSFISQYKPAKRETMHCPQENNKTGERARCSVTIEKTVVRREAVTEENIKSINFIVAF